MTAPGISLIAIGSSLLCSGLIFLLPTALAQGDRMTGETLDEDKDRAHFDIQQKQQERVEAPHPLFS
jgi:hypothetical protein